MAVTKFERGLLLTSIARYTC